MMRRTSILLCWTAAALGSGCVLVSNTARNLINEPRVAISESQFRRKAISLAEQAWAENCTAWPEASAHFAEGYIDGFADYLYAGRTTDPKVNPPKRYQKLVYHTPETLAAIDDYFAGFNQGAIDAQASGLRNAMVVPVALPAPPAPPGAVLPPPSMHPVPPASPAEILPPAPTPPAELLPRPRELPGT